VAALLCGLPARAVLALEQESGAGMELPSLAQSVREQLDGTRWELELTPLGHGGQPAAQEDTLAFAGRQVTSAWLSGAGYSGASYVLKVDAAGTVSWETLQANAGDGVVFWRGAFTNDTVRGAVSRQPLTGPVEDFAFTGREVSGRTVGLAPPTHAEASAAGSRQAQRRTKATAARKRRWAWFGR
jgi:hypothetical protein